MVGGAAIMFSVPFVTRYLTPNMYQKEKLTGSQMQRGLFTSNGTDGGVDPDFDFKTNTYRGRGSRNPKEPKQHQETTHDDESRGRQ